ncbi:ParA family protein [Rickettsia argasii]|uniref:CobQ/CobB/MinD/ParA nucleotide binding domain protein n=1 Tax=Rickettsia argasii T170-B TaxID=1268837 RepID=A0A0F3RCG1_9RICK|nr:ParA family protein [Rickettsia argasii]KJW03797.1 cobQ/CobB/MinD/ParA nucleotide binding domain protein [Rickettsia argasii T170-B]
MNTQIVTLATSKGGVGKSTIARNIAVHWSNIGMRVAIIDADPQGSIIRTLFGRVSIGVFWTELSYFYGSALTK